MSSTATVGVDDKGLQLEVKESKEEAKIENEDYPDDPETTKCDYSFCAPAWLQKLRKRWLVLVWMCWCTFTQSMIVNGFVNSVVTSLEKRYGLSSKESGAIASFYDVGVVLVLIPVSFFGGRTRRLRFLAYGMAIMGAACFLFAVPHFTAGPYKYQTPLQPVCYRGQNVSYLYDRLCDQILAAANLNNYKWVFWVAHMLIGIGASPLYTLGIAYLDDNLSTKSSAVHLGIFYCFSILGPAVGFLGAAFTLEHFVDLGRPHPGLTPANSEIWVGAWWLGFVICAVISVCAFVPLYGFPREMPGTAKMKAEKKSEAFGESETSGLAVSISSKDFLKNVGIVVSNPTFIFLSLSAFAESVVTSGVSTFGPKYVETAFGFSAGWAARIFGFILVPMGGGGMVAGGIIIRCLQLSLIQILRLQAFVSVLPLPLSLAFLIPCGEVGGSPGWAGITTHYTNVSTGSYNLNSTCNAGCQCRSIGALFSPQCGADKRTYYSPCYAGCGGAIENRVDNVTKYLNCSCIDDAANPGGAQLAAGACTKSCPHLVYFLVLFAISIFFTFSISTPGISATMRSVPEKQKNLALGIQWLIIRILGTIPGPIIMGAAFDSACLSWSSSCGEESSCSLYSGARLREYLLIIVLTAKVFSSISLFLAWFLYKPSARVADEAPKTTAEGQDNPAMDATDL